MTARAKTPARSSTHLITPLLIFVFSLALLYIVFSNRLIHVDFSPYTLGGPDATEYTFLARHLLRKQDFSHIIFGLRPPLLPAYMAVIYALSGRSDLAVVFFNIVLGAMTAVLTYKLALRLTGKRLVSTIAGFLLALDFSHIDAMVSLMSEPLHNFLLMVGLYWFVRLVQDDGWRALIVMAVMLSLAMLVRPGSVYLPLVLALLLIVLKPREWRKAAALFVICLIPYLGWSFRNLHYRDSFSYSTSGPFTLLFYRGVAIESHATGRDPADVATDVALEVEHRMGNTDVTRADVADYAVGRDADRFTTTAAREDLIQQMAIERMLAYPKWTAILSAVSLFRQFIPTPLPIPEGIQWAQIALYLALALVGGWNAYHQKDWLMLLLIGLILAYFLVLPALTHSGLYASRYRTAWMPVGVIFSATGVVILARHFLHGPPGATNAA